MPSKKCYKYMQQYQERNYAPKTRKLEKSDLKQHSNRGESRETSEASCCDCLLRSREGKEEEKVNHSLSGEESEILREEDVSKTYQERRQGVQEPDQGRCQAQETDHSQTKGEEMKKQTMKEKKHEAKETKAYERKEEKKEKSSKPEKKK